MLFRKKRASTPQEGASPRKLHQHPKDGRNLHKNCAPESMFLKIRGWIQEKLLKERRAPVCEPYRALRSGKQDPLGPQKGGLAARELPLSLSIPSGRNRIISRAPPGMAFRDPSKSQPQTLGQTPLSKGLGEIGRTGGIKPTGMSDQG